MPKFAAYIRLLFLPVSIGLIALLAAGWYNFIWLPAQLHDLDARNFRLLKTMGEQIKASVDNFDKMLDNAAAFGVKGGDGLRAFFKDLNLDMEGSPAEAKSVLAAADYDDPPRVMIRSDEGTHFLYLGYSKAQNRTQVRYDARMDVSKLISRVVSAAQQSAFDLLRLTETYGTVVYQHADSAADVSHVDLLEESANSVSSKDKETPSLSTKWKSLRSTSGLTEVIVGGATYRLYTQPVQLSLPAAHGNDKAASVDDSNSTHLVLCGLVRSEHFREEMHSMSYAYTLWLTAAVLLALALYPLLKIYLAGRTARLRRNDIIVATVFVSMTTAILTLVFVDLYYWERKSVIESETQMRTIAQAIDQNLGKESDLIGQQLHLLDKARRAEEPLQNTGSEYAPLPSSGNGRKCNPPQACKEQILGGADMGLYPQLEMVFWSDACGHQRIKWTVRDRVTAFVNEAEQSIGYYANVKSALNFASAPQHGIGTLYSPNTGENLAIFWRTVEQNKITPCPGENKREEASPATAALVTSPLSVVQPIMPAGLSFAILSADGRVIFHSDAARNLRENFFDETNHDRSLESLVHSRVEDTLTAKYLGRQQRIYIKPATSVRALSLWSIVVFHDLRSEQRLNLETLTLASALFILYALLVSGVLLLIYYVRRTYGFGLSDKRTLADARLWLYPNRQNVFLYRRSAVWNLAAALALLVMTLASWWFAILACAFLIPASAVLLDMRRFRGPIVSSETSPYWRTWYTARAVSLLFIVTVLPTLLFFVVAYDFSQSLHMKSNQLDLEQQISARDNRLRDRYRNVELGKYKDAVVGMKDLEHALYSYHASIFQTEIDPKLPPLAGLKYLDRDVARFLGRIATYFPYNEVAAANAYLAADGSDLWNWQYQFRDKFAVVLNKKEPDSTIASYWDPVQVPWSDWRWWLGVLLFAGVLFHFVSFMSRRLFPLGILDKNNSGIQPAFSPDSLLERLPANLFIIGSPLSRFVLLLKQHWNGHDIRVLLEGEARLMKEQPSGNERLVKIAPMSRERWSREFHDPSLFYNFECKEEQLDLVDEVAVRQGKTVVLISYETGMPSNATPQEQRGHTLLAHFMRIDLRSKPGMPELDPTGSSATIPQFERKAISNAYYRWILSGCSRDEQLVLA